MPRIKRLTEEEKREKKNEYERRRKEKIRNDPVLREQYRQKERERYARRKAEGLVTRSNMDVRSLRILRRKNGISALAYYKRKKSKAAAQPINPSTDVVLPIVNEEENPLTTQPPTSEDGLDLQPNGSRCVDVEDNQRIKRARRTLQSNRSMSSDRVLRSTYRSAHVEDIESSIPHFCVRSRSLHCSPSRASPTLTAHSTETMSCPSSPASVASLEFKKEFRAKFRKYQKTKSKQITDLKEKLVKIAKINWTYKKRYNRLTELLKTTPKRVTNVQSLNTSKYNMDQKQKRLRSIVVKFYEDDENSITCPGKKDIVSKGGVQKQKRLLTDTLKNLHLKYVRAGYPPISYVTFSRMRPFWVKQPDLSKRDTCLCEKHDNMKLLISALKNANIIKENSISAVLDSMCCDKENVACLMRECCSCKNRSLNYQEFNNATEVVYYAWGRNKFNYLKNGVEKTTTRVEKVRKYVKPLDLIKIFEQNVTPFFKHCGNIKNQSSTIYKIKQNMSVNDCLIHIDFSENYETKYGSEIQAVHFGGSRTQLTLHTAVLYFKLDELTAKTQAFCTISTSLRHDAAAAWAHIVPILEEIEKTAPLVRNLHIVSDSPSSQYRNKKMLYIISQLSSHCPMLTNIVWHYCECGHGKGAPDGVGGLLKRTADKVVSYGNDIPDIDNLVEKLKSCIQGVKIEIVADYEVIEKDWLLPKKLKSFPGTMKVHQVIWTKETGNCLALRCQSCIEPECLSNAIMCSHGKHMGFHDLTKNCEIGPQKNYAETKSKQDDNLQTITTQSKTKLNKSKLVKSKVNLTKLKSVQMSDILTLSPKTSNSRDATEVAEIERIPGHEHKKVNAKSKILHIDKGKLQAKSESLPCRISPSKLASTPKILKNELLTAPLQNVEKSIPVTLKPVQMSDISTFYPKTSNSRDSSEVAKTERILGFGHKKVNAKSKIGKGKLQIKKSESLPCKISLSKLVSTPKTRQERKDKLMTVPLQNIEMSKPVGKGNSDLKPRAVYQTPSTSKTPAAANISEKKSTGSTSICSSLLSHYENEVLDEIMPSCTFLENVDSKMFSDNEKSINSDNLSHTRISNLNQNQSRECLREYDTDSSDYDIF